MFQLISIRNRPRKLSRKPIRLFDRVITFTNGSHIGEKNGLTPWIFCTLGTKRWLPLSIKNGEGEKAKKSKTNFDQEVRPKPDLLHRLCKLSCKPLGLFDGIFAFANSVLKIASPTVSLAQLEQIVGAPSPSTDGEGEKAVDLLSF
jgi:hypothetical protein